MLLPVLAMMLACLGFRGMLAYPQVYSLFSGSLMEEKAEMSTQYYLRFASPARSWRWPPFWWPLCTCCAASCGWSGCRREQKGRQEPEES